MYRYRYINQHSQFGRTSCTLILEDLETSMPQVRIDKEFAVPADQLDEETLYQAAAIEITNAQAAYSELVAAQVDQINDDSGD